jgi:quercetin dioxygenase-like cupin family protein
MSKNIIDLQESKYCVPLSKEHAAPGKFVDGIVLTGEGLQLLYNYFDAGTEIPFHSHPHEAMILLLEGTTQNWVGDECFILRPGWALWIPSNIPHRLVVGDQPAIEVEIFTPPRDDLAKKTEQWDFRWKPEPLKKSLADED